MYIVHVHIHVKAEHLDDFRAATIENARNSALEPGILSFDFLQSQEDPTRFMLVEVYREPEAQQRHRESRHYQVWRDAVTDWLAEPRTHEKYSLIYPAGEDRR
jgi:quinol monooxygenase YgiN